MSHGDEDDALYGIDGKLSSLTTLLEPVKKCRTLAGKPKICIIQVAALFKHW